MATVGGRARGGVAQRLWQAVEVAFLQQHHPVGFVLEDVLREIGAEGGQPAGDLGIALLLFRRQQHARAHETVVGQFQHALLLGRERERVALLPDGFHATEQRLVQADRRIMVGEHGRQFALDCLQLGGRFGACQVPEYGADPVHGRARTFQRGNRIVEVGRRGIGHDGRDLGIVLGHGALVGGLEILRADAVERRQLERAGPGLEKRVLAGR